MNFATHITITHEDAWLSCSDACRIADQAMADPQPDMVFIDLRRTTDTTTGALARLVLLRRELLEHGRDLRILGPSARAAGLYEINHMSNLLPQERMEPSDFAAGCTSQAVRE